MSRLHAALCRFLRCNTTAGYKIPNDRPLPHEIREASHRLANHATEVQALTRRMTEETDVLTVLTRAMRASYKNDS